MRQLSCTLAMSGLLALVLGCEEFDASPPVAKAPAPAPKPVQKPTKPNPAATSNRKGPGGQPSVEELQKELDIISKAYDASRQSGGLSPREFTPGGDPYSSASPSSGGSRFTGLAYGQTEEAAVGKIATAIKESVELSPTLVVWIIDRTPSAQRLMSQAARAAQNYYDSPDVKAWAQAANQPLLTAVVTYDEQVTFALDPPTADIQQIHTAFRSVQATESNREKTCTAIKEALEKYQSVRMRDRREVLLVVITDEAADDRPVADDVLALARRNAIPIYCLGLSAPWGQTNPFAKDPKAVDPSADDSTPTFGPESVASERVDISGWGSGYSGRATELIDSGFGPYVLERICRGSRGKFFALRGSSSGGGVNRDWPTGSEARFDEGTLSKYAPDYVSEAEYQKLLGENKARAALVAAARLPRVVVDGSPSANFPKQAEAQMARQLSQAQQFAAKNSPPVDQLYEALAPGESDREKLTSARWQAEYDLAMGRVCAIKARLDGYNSMIAALKRGKTFKNEGSSLWVLEPADAYETESTIKRLADRAKMYLERVQREHPGTPWAAIAEEELRAPLGWTWRES